MRLAKFKQCKTNMVFLIIIILMSLLSYKLVYKDEHYDKSINIYNEEVNKMFDETYTVTIYDSEGNNVTNSFKKEHKTLFEKHDTKNISKILIKENYSIIISLKSIELVQ